MGNKAIRVQEPGAAWGYNTAVDPSYAQMVERLAAQAAAGLGSYQLRVAAAALLGYAVVLTLVATLLGVSGWIVTVMIKANSFSIGGVNLALGAGLIGLGIARTFWVPLEPPQGISLQRSDAPRLYAMIDEIAASIGVRPADHVQLTDDFNASATQHPRFGIFGWHETYLQVGLPLLQALSAAEARAVLAHEFGHFAGSHSKFGAWVYRARQTWAQISERFPDGFVAKLLGRFFRWYGPWFNAYSFVLARQQEFDADAISARVAGSATAARALARVGASARRYDHDFWAAYWDGAERSPTPSPYPYSASASYLAESGEIEGAHLQSALAARTDLEDTHPSLSDRLLALGEAAPVLEPCPDPAAESLLWPSLDRLTAQLDEAWWQVASENWRERYDERVQAEARYGELARMAAEGPLPSAEMLEFALLTERCETANQALSRFASLAGPTEDGRAARYHQARLMLAAGDPAGLDVIDALMAEDPTWCATAADLAADFLRGDALQADRLAGYEAIVQSEAATEEAVAIECNGIEPGTKLEASRLAENVLDELRAVCAAHPPVMLLLVARRRLQARPRDHQLIAMFQTRGAIAQEYCDGFMDKILAVLQPHGYALMVQDNSSRRWLRRQLEAVPDSITYRG